MDWHTRWKMNGLTVSLYHDVDPMPPSDWDAPEDATEWAQWREGDVHGYVIENGNGDHIDSCWSFYGFDWACESANEAANAYDWSEILV